MQDIPHILEIHLNNRIDLEIVPYRFHQMIIALAIAAIFLVGGDQNPAAEYNQKFDAWLKTPDEPAKVKPKTIKRTFAWLDATPSITYRGGVKYRDPSIAPWNFSIVVSVDEARAKAIEKHFGVPMDAIQFAFTSPEEKARCQKLEQAKVAHHGMQVTMKSGGAMGILQANYQWLVDGCRDQIQPITQSILRETDRVLKESSAPRVATPRDKVAAIFRFIQSIPYETIPDLPDGKDRCGMRTPLITLLKGGDCDSKSTLMAAFIRSKQISDVVIVTLKMKDGTGHAILGARVDVQRGDQTITYNGEKYVLAEAATSDTAHDGNLADLGEIGDEWRDFQSRPFEIYPVH